MSQWISEQHRLGHFTVLKLEGKHKRKAQIRTPDGETLDIVDAPDAIPLSDTEYSRKRFTISHREMSKIEDMLTRNHRGVNNAHSWVISPSKV